MRAYRSPLKLFVFGIVGIVLIAAAADIMFGHWLSTPPENNDGVLTTRGQAQQRGDLLWGGAMLATGVLLFGGSITELIRRKPVVIVSGDGLILDTGGDGVLIPWDDVTAVSSGVVEDPYDGSPREQLVVEIRTGFRIPDDLSGLVRVDDKVYIDAHDWANRVTEVALAAQGAHDHHQRMMALRFYEPPSMEWQTATAEQSDTDRVPEAGELEIAPVGREASKSEEEDE